MATLTRSEIERALGALGALASSRGAHVELFAVGGAVMVLKFDARPSTKDIDAVILSPLPVSLVREMAARVASDFGWPEDWLNDAAKGFVGGRVTGEVLFDAPGITVHAAPIAQMLALKLGAWRDDIDMADAELLLHEMSGSREQVWRAVAEYLPHGLELKSQYAFEQLWEAVHGAPT